MLVSWFLDWGHRWGVAAANKLLLLAAAPVAHVVACRTQWRRDLGTVPLKLPADQLVNSSNNNIGSRGRSREFAIKELVPLLVPATWRKTQNQRTTTGSGYFKTLQELLGIPGTGSSLILIEGERGYTQKPGGY